MPRTPSRPAWRLASVVAVLFAMGPAAARPLDLSLKLEPAVGFPLEGPQRDAFGVGGGGFVKGAYGPVGWLDIQLTLGGLAFQSKQAGGGTPGLFGVGAGPRLQLPHRTHRFSPFVDADLMYVKTGELHRFGYALGAGLLVAVERRRIFWLGVHARYVQVVQGEKPNIDETDAKVLLFGLSLEVGTSRQPDADGDGVPDGEDRCPLVAGPAVNHGCPVLDSDGDGLLDHEDQCPGKVGPKENKGCPWPDVDKDGVLDREDRCPNEPGPALNDGCPWPDSDGDGLNDREDKCPTVPGSPALGGCPDKDKDGVPEPTDQCPDTPGPADNNGCPKYKTITVTRQKIELNQKIFFAYDKADILPKSFGLLNEVAQALKDYPALRVRIEGHTDSRGSEKHNEKLSQDRAGSVMRYLTDHGVPASRLEARGYGSVQPLDTNKTAEGRDRNRRVEFVVLSSGDGGADGAAAPAQKGGGAR